MNLSPIQIDKVSEDLRSFLRAEARTKKIRKMDPSFYRNIVTALETLSEESQKELSKRDIGAYIKVKERMDEIERDFKALFQKRFEKIASLSIYDLDTELMSSLTPEEKDFIIKLHNLLQDQFRVLLQRGPATPVPEEPEIRKKVEEDTKPSSEEKVEEAQVETENSEELVLVLVKEDLPPIAQPDRDYTLHEQDLIYIRKNFADLLIKRGAAVKINL